MEEFIVQLTIKALTKQFGAKTAVNQVTAELGVGVYGLLGANGAGKTTLMRMLCGILNPTSGSVAFDGQPIAALDEAYRDLLGYLPQDFGYYPDFSAEEFMWYIAALKGLPLSAGKLKTKQLLTLVALSDVARKKIRTFSGGMRQRLGIAQAMLNDPRFLVLDEPTAGLDPKERVRFRNLIADLAKDKIVLLSTHIVSDVEYIADQILVMKKGTLIMRGTVAELTASLAGAVWTCRVPAHEVDEWNARYTISNLKHDGPEVELRIVSKEQPVAGAVPTQSTLEDLYLYHFQDELDNETAAPGKREAR